MPTELTFFLIAFAVCVVLYFLLVYTTHVYPQLHYAKASQPVIAQQTDHYLSYEQHAKSILSYDTRNDSHRIQLIVAPWDRIIDTHSWDVSKLHEYDLHETQLQSVCKSTYWNALQRTIYYSYVDNTTFVITGDIQDMWIRDSTEQIWPYFSIIHKYKYIQSMIYGAIIKQAQLITADIYTNAYRKEAYCYDNELEILIKTSIVATRDDEIDSGAYFVKLLYKYYYVTQHESILHENHHIKQAIIYLLNMWQIEQYHNQHSVYKGNKSVTHAQNLRISASLDGIGMIWTSHRPSDDLCKYPYHIADNFFVHQALSFIKIFAEIWHNDTMYNIADGLQHEIYEGIHKYGVKQHDVFGDIYCYEVDGFGACNVMDDANIPSLLSIPMITNKYNATIYANTRRCLLSTYNPYYYKSKSNKVSGIGSPHTPQQYIWPLSLIIQGFTANDEHEKYEMLQMLYENTGGTQLMHESFNVNNDKRYTRKFFSWANSFFSVYARCMQQFMVNDKDQIDEIIKIKVKSDRLIGSLSSIKEPMTQKIHQANPKYIQWLKKCEKKGANKYIDNDRRKYKSVVFDTDFLSNEKH